MKIDRSCDRCSDSLRRHELVGWIDDSHPDQRTPNALLNVFLPDEFFFDLIRALKRSEVVRRPNSRAGRFKPEMISVVVPGERQRTVPKLSCFTATKQDSKFSTGCVIGFTSGCPNSGPEQ